ncbi:MAG TPA: DUF4242 domain-containing protein [Chitinophagaceae bacterium]|nr:DUF4242 domain-containing protein [Chitinophagaceae bacterium]
MKLHFAFTGFVATCLFSFNMGAQTGKFNQQSSKNIYIDVHHLGAGKATAKDVEEAHKKDLAVQKKYGVTILKYWFDEAKGDVYCLSTADNSESIRKTHAEAHGLLPAEFYQVTEGQEAIMKGKNDLYLDVHELGEGKVTAADVAGAHQKDLAVQGKYGVNLINYWVDEKKGIVMCLAQAPDSTALINTHKEAHGLVPIKVIKVKQGQ